MDRPALSSTTRPRHQLVSLAICLLFCLYHTSTASSGSGYDSSGSCNPRPSRRGRAQLLATIPCDLTIQAYCNLPGTAYPWNAVRRFVHENQGLMKRMYGDTRHISILKTEFEKNEIDVDDIEVAAARYSRNGQRREERKSKYAFTEHGGRLNDVLTEPHFRPTTMSTTTTRMKDSTTTTTTSQPSQTTPISPSEEEAKGSGPTESTSIPDLSVTLSYTDEVEQLKNKYDILSNEDEAQDDGSVETNSIYENTTEGHLAPPLSYNQEKLPQPSNNQTISMEMGDSKERLPISSTLKIVNPDPIEDFGDMIITESEGGFRESASVVQVSKEQNPNSSTTKNQHQPLDRVDDFSAESSEIYTDVKPSPPLSSQSQYGEEKSQTPLPQTAGTQQQPPTQGQTIMEGHLYQDSLQKNNNPPVMSGRGVNACPVKEEVVAPFWANNTRGEVLALLNLYPFEQYVHWEKCTHEHKQMYCREGCRCEQQYRLHRLLAYDPHNECRGIFSDWFRFPSCCICKCYDIPNEFRVTSRSPRSPREAPQQKQGSYNSPGLEEAEQHLHQAIYEHATEDWYRARRSAKVWPEVQQQEEGEDDFDNEDILDLN